jgi:hypothetical protein
MGEVLATPSALELEGIAVCLVDVPDDLRVERLRQRGSKSWSPQLEQALLNWAVWHRGHASDPQHRPGAIVSAGWEDMAWHRWSGWSKGDSRWSTALIDTADCSVASAAEELLEWIETCRAARKEGARPLLRGWASA